MLERMQGETALQHHRRLIEGKLVDKTLSDYDYAELAPYVYGQDYSADVARRMMYGSAKTLQIVESERENDCIDEPVIVDLERMKVEIQKEKQKLFDQRVEFRRAIREQARDEELKEIIERTIAAGNLPALDYEPFDEYESDNSLVVSLNDLHYGANHDNYWGKYNSDICKQMLSKYLVEIQRIASVHGSQDCYVVCNGDSISGNIHNSIRVTNKENVIQQITGVSELIAEFLTALSPYFSSVYYSSVAGNHSRMEKKEDAPIGERLDDLVEWYLKARLQNFENIHIGYGDKIDTTMYVMNVRGLNFLGVHGDFDPTITNITNLQAMVGMPIHAVVMGHRHHNYTETVQGIKVIQSGSFLGTDDYCITKRLFGKPEQIVTVVGDSGVICNYDVDLSIK